HPNGRVSVDGCDGHRRPLGAVLNTLRPSDFRGTAPMGLPVLPSQDSPSVSSSIGERTSYRKLQTPRCGTGSVTIAPVRVHYSTLTYLRRGGDAANEVREVEVVSHVSILACGVLREPSRADLITYRSGLSGLSGEGGVCVSGYSLM